MFEDLKREFAEGRNVHAYLFVGREKSGKFRFAVDLARELLGEFAKVDLVEMGGSESIKIKEVQELISKVSLACQGEFRIVVIADVERMTLAAANAFLKTLEEPPGGTIFFLTSGKFSEVLPTIASRSRVIRVRDNREGIKEKREDLDKVRGLMEEGTVVSRFKFVEELALEERERVKDFLDLLKVYFRKKMLEDKDRLVMAEKLSKIEDAGILLAENVNVRLLLENLMLDLCP